MRIDRDLFVWGVSFAPSGGLALENHHGLVAGRASWSWPLIRPGRSTD